MTWLLTHDKKDDDIIEDWTKMTGASAPDDHAPEWVAIRALARETLALRRRVEVLEAAR